MKKLIACVIASVAAASAHAYQPVVYGGAGISAWKLKDTALDDQGQLNLTSLEGHAGIELLPWLAVDGRLGLGVEREKAVFKKYLYSQSVQTPNAAGVLVNTGEYDLTSTNYDVKGELKYFASLYAKPQLKNDIAILYGLIGVTSYEFAFAGNIYESRDRYKDNPPEDGKAVPPTFISSISGGQTYWESNISDVSFSMGVGVGFYFNENFVFNVEYKNFLQSFPVGDSNRSYEAAGVTAIIDYQF
jgi:hypothetical protein